MWTRIASIILRNRVLILALVLASTLFMAYHAGDARMSYSLAQMLPQDDSAYIEHVQFKEIFGEEANIFAVGVQDDKFFKLDHYQKWKLLVNSLKQIRGVKNVTSVTELIRLNKNKEAKRFDICTIFPDTVNTQHQLDSLKKVLFNFPIYNGLIYNDSLDIYLMTISIDKKLLNTEERISIVEDIHKLTKQFMANTGLKLYHSGLPYIRTEVSKKIKKELSLFIILAAFVVILVLMVLFRSYKAVLVSMSVVTVAVIWTFATVAMLGYEITILTGMLPPLLIVIGVPNSIFMINKYLHEYSAHGNKIKSLQRMIKKTGSAIFLTNLTTASGFGTFILTSSDILKEFGVVAAINIIGIFVFSLLIIPTIYSYLPDPKDRHTKHLDSKVIVKFVHKLVYLTEHKRRWVYASTIVLLVISIYGITLINTTGYIVDDIPKDDPIYTDLKFFENTFGGLMPFEIVIDTKKQKGAQKISTLTKVDKLQRKLKHFDELSKPISLANGVKLARQAFFNNKKTHYKLPSNQEKNFIFSYLAKMDNENNNNNNFIHSFIDSTQQITRISYKVKDLGTNKMDQLHADVQLIVDSIFPPGKYKTSITGTSIVYTKGTTFLIQNLFVSLTLAIVLIAFFMALMFRSARMVVVSLIPNLIPLLFTAGIMGYFAIPIKPSTILIFSIAFGISVDDTIHFLAKYRQELKIFNWDIGSSVRGAINETGVSMFYTSIVLLFGFSIFTASDFGGTVALGLLVSITLFFAMLTNLVLLPSLLLSLEKQLTTKAFNEPLLSIFDEEEDIELDHLTIDNRE
ncbi:MAG: MMPL family transporter [Bacteroidales bacterium]|nr:MMPL family transporter [Bacteroidales bacterium]